MTEKEKGMPVLGHPEALPFPWSIIIKHSAQAFVNHGQTLERLRDRGGLAPDELVAILENRSYTKMDVAQAFSKLRSILNRERSVIRAAPEHDAERMANLKARLQAKIAQKDSERGRPLTASEKLANLWQAIFAEEQEPRR